ncbi:MAG: PEP-CTERM sorting domain-containing protein [Acidobacteria bacterium]|nr:PEP-CTERM sorting domain-containing protein [Acidobacteriota bacterium]
MKRLSVSLIALAAWAASATAGVLIGGPAEPSSGSSVPFGNDQYRGFQQVYRASLFSESIKIGGLTFFNSNDFNSPTHDPMDPNYPVVGAIHQADYAIRLGTVPTGFTLSGDLNANLIQSTDLTYFFVGSMGGNVDGQFTRGGNQKTFFYDPTQGDLILDIRKTQGAPELTMFLDVNSTSGNGLSIAFVNDPSPNITEDCLGCVMENYGLVTQFEVAGSTQYVPILPDISGDGSFSFEEQAGGMWFDPPALDGFTFKGGVRADLTMTLFSGIEFPLGFVGDFTLLDAQQKSLGTFSGGSKYTFSSPVSEFSIVGINPAPDYSDPSAFPLWIEFDQPTGVFSMAQFDPLPPPPTGAVPEPSALWLSAGGLFALLTVARRR